VDSAHTGLKKIAVKDVVTIRVCEKQSGSGERSMTMHISKGDNMNNETQDFERWLLEKIFRYSFGLDVPADKIVDADDQFSRTYIMRPDIIKYDSSTSTTMRIFNGNDEDTPS
jgi:hypothetical protein